MIEDLDLLRAAKLLINWHGPNASSYAAFRAHRHLQSGDLDAGASWRRIRLAVEEMQPRPDAGVMESGPSGSPGRLTPQRADGGAGYVS